MMIPYHGYETGSPLASHHPAYPGHGHQQQEQQEPVPKYTR